jgi:hypothetical protein
MDGFSAIIGEMQKAYPNPTGVRPVANYPATMYGVTITFHVGSLTLAKSESILTNPDHKLGRSRLPASYTTESCTSTLVGRPLRLPGCACESGLCCRISCG